MILSGLEIKNRLGTDIVIEPFDEKQLNPNSYNVRLHNTLMTYTDDVLDMKKPLHTNTITIPESGLLLNPKTLYLGRTLEYTRTENLVPMIEGRSSIGRLGIFIHITAGFGDVGFHGYWTLEITCLKPTIIYPGIQIGQLFYHTIAGNFVRYASNKYQDNTGIQPSLLYKDFEASE